jgi:hypothetical protein
MQEEHAKAGRDSGLLIDADEEQGSSRPPSSLDQHELRSRHATPTQSTFPAFRKPITAPRRALPSALAELVSAFEQSQLASDNTQDIIAVSSSATQALTNGSQPISDVEADMVLSGYKRASWWTQFRILSGRAFKNLYRNPYLMLAHYLLSGLLAVICSCLFRGVTWVPRRASALWLMP